MATQIVVTDLKQAFEQARDLDGSMNERLDVFANATRMLHPTTTAIVLTSRPSSNTCSRNSGMFTTMGWLRKFVRQPAPALEGQA